MCQRATFRTACGLLSLVLLAVSACSRGAEREVDTAEEARRQRILEARAESPIGAVGDDDIALLDGFLLWRGRWDTAANEAFLSLSASDPQTERALEALGALVEELQATRTDGVDETVRTWFAEIVSGYEEQAAALHDLADATASGQPGDEASAALQAAYERTAAVEVRLLREVADWIGESGTRARDRLHGIADAIEQEDDASGTVG